jgi:hypothetical protein
MRAARIVIFVGDGDRQIVTRWPNINLIESRVKDRCLSGGALSRL